MAEGATSPPPLSAGMSLPFNLNETLGATFIGFTLSTILYGVGCVQMYLYFQRNANEHRITKALVFLLCILETAWMAFWAMALYIIFVTNYLNPAVSLTPPWSLETSYIIGVVSNSVVVGIYTHRLWRLSGRKATGFVVFQVIAELVNCGFGITYAVLGGLRSLLQLGPEFGWVYYVQFAASTLGSISIAISLCSLLRKMKTGVARTDSVIWIIMKYSISACVLTSLVNVASIVALAVAPTTLIYVAVMPIQPKIVLNSLLAFLNSRDSFKRETTAPVSIHLSKLQPSGPTSNQNQSFYASRVSVSDTKDIDSPAHIHSSPDSGV